MSGEWQFDFATVYEKYAIFYVWAVLYCTLYDVFVCLFVCALSDGDDDGGGGGGSWWSKAHSNKVLAGNPMPFLFIY